MYNVLLTGSTGFVGQHLIPELKDDYVLSYINRSDNGNPNQHIANIDADSDYTRALKEINVVIHCAARVHIMAEKSESPLDEFRAVNTQGTLNLATQAARAGVKRFIFVSTIKVNGESTTGRAPFNEQESAPEDPYGIF